MPLDDTELETLVDELVKLAEPDYKKDAGNADVMVVIHENLPVLIVPTSPRARALFIRWGMEKDCTGIAPPDSPMDLIASVPGNWIMKSAPIQEGAHTVARITLPQPLLVVH